ncbi:spheroidene monooxygenase [Pedobacter rhizosphaerae]|uniref:Spheroidene monooxygenase n=2 Tax=Pedobacter rhizosphaerae TaxID=390241 RepID=A0A1H9MCH5_9SPHI|nr:spheroidene monooxygenase [Pedobacter rhizosphaerae]
MIVALTITKYRGLTIPFAFLGMAILRLPLILNRKCKFWKLMGSGKNAQVDLAPDFKHWAILTTWENKTDADTFYKKSFVVKWFRFFGKEEFTILLNPLSSHGLWSGKEPFKTSTGSTNPQHQVAVITRAAIRLSRLTEFRRNIKRAAESMRKAEGFILSAGIGENPLFDQATFSVWENLESMKNYAYRNFDHSDVIKLTRARKWYSEELFARFEILESWGSLNGLSLSSNNHSNHHN